MDALEQQRAAAADPLNESFAAVMLEYAHGAPIPAISRSEARSPAQRALRGEQG